MRIFTAHLTSLPFPEVRYNPARCGTIFQRRNKYRRNFSIITMLTSSSALIFQIWNDPCYMPEIICHF